MKKSTRRSRAEIAAANQIVCADWYSYARQELLQGNEKAALYWQNGAAAHFVKTAHYMGILSALLAK